MVRKHREYSIGHSCRGFTLEARDYPLARWITGTVVGRAVEAVLSAVGHPCCGRGLGRVSWVSEPAYRLLNWAVNLQMGAGERVTQVVLTPEQAFALRPDYVAEVGPDGWITLDGEDEHGDLWSGAVLVGVRCDACGEVVDAAGRWSARVRADHAGECRG